MSKKLITSIIFAVILVVFIVVSYVCIGKGVTQNQHLAIWLTAFGIIIACGLSYLFADSKPITSTISIIYVVLSIALGAIEAAEYVCQGKPWHAVVSASFTMVSIFSVGSLLASPILSLGGVVALSITFMVGLSLLQNLIILEFSTKLCYNQAYKKRGAENER